MRRLHLVLASVFCVSFPAAAQITLDFGPESFSIPVEGQNINFIGKGKASLFTPQGAQRMDVDVDLSIDLSDLQRAIPPIIQAKGNRNDTCSEVVTLHTIGLRSNADLYVGGHFEKWACAYLFGKLVGKTKVVEQDGDVTIGLSLGVQGDGKGLEIKTATKNAHMNGALGALMSNSLTGAYVTNSVTGAIQKAIDPGNLKHAFPAALNAYNPVVKSAKFVDLGSNKLGVNSILRFSLSQTEAQKLIDQLRKK
jgi:hypothetical protein